MSTAKIGFSGFDATIANYTLTQIGPISPDSHFAPALSVVATIGAGEDTFTFPAPGVAGDYNFSVQAYDSDGKPVGGPAAATVNVPAAPPVPPTPAPADNVPAMISVSL